MDMNTQDKFEMMSTIVSAVTTSEHLTQSEYNDVKDAIEELSELMEVPVSLPSMPRIVADESSDDDYDESSY